MCALCMLIYTVLNYIKSYQVQRVVSPYSAMLPNSFLSELKDSRHVFILTVVASHVDTMELNE